MRAVVTQRVCGVKLCVGFAFYFSATLETTLILNSESIVVKVTPSFITPSVYSFIIRLVIIHISMATWLGLRLCRDWTTGNDFKCHSDDGSRKKRHCQALMTSLPVCTFSNNLYRAHFTRTHTHIIVFSV